MLEDKQKSVIETMCVDKSVGRKKCSSMRAVADPVSHIPCVPARASSGDDARPPPIVPSPGHSRAGQVTR